jgi:hypothetical protein
MLDIFKSDAFGIVPLTDAINKVKFVPSRLKELGIFNSGSVATIDIALEERDGLLTLVSPSPRGGPGMTVDKQKRQMRSIRIPHFQIDDAIMAEEVQGVRAFGSETAVETVMGKVAERMAIHTQSLEATEEYARAGAIKGIVTYADGSSLDLFNTMGVPQAPEIDFNLGSVIGPDTGELRRVCSSQVRRLSDALENIPFTGIHALCGDNFFDALLGNKEVRSTYQGWSEAQILRDSYLGPNRSTYGMFQFGGIVWENYRGGVGPTAFVDSDWCHLFPLGVPGLFRDVYGPADYVETANTMGLPRYMRQWIMENGKGVNMEAQTNVAHYCTRPGVLLTGSL